MPKFWRCKTFFLPLQSTLLLACHPKIKATSLSLSILLLTIVVSQDSGSSITSHGFVYFFLSVSSIPYNPLSTAIISIIGLNNNNNNSSLTARWKRWINPPCNCIVLLDSKRKIIPIGEAKIYSWSRIWINRAIRYIYMIYKIVFFILFKSLKILNLWISNNISKSRALDLNVFLFNPS